jgi:hypothetical protein
MQGAPFCSGLRYERDAGYFLSCPHGLSARLSANTTYVFHCIADAVLKFSMRNALLGMHHTTAYFLFREETVIPPRASISLTVEEDYQKKVRN